MKKFIAWAKKNNCWHSTKETKTEEEAKKVSIEMFENSNAEIAGYTILDTHGKDVMFPLEYVETCKR